MQRLRFQYFGLNGKHRSEAKCFIYKERYLKHSRTVLNCTTNHIWTVWNPEPYMFAGWFYGVGVAQSFTCPPHDFHMMSYPGGMASMWMTKLPHDFHMLSYPGVWPASGWPMYYMTSTWCHAGAWASMWITNLPIFETSVLCISIQCWGVDVLPEWWAHQRYFWGKLIIPTFFPMIILKSDTVFKFNLISLLFPSLGRRDI